MKLKTILEEIAWDRSQKGRPDYEVRPPITEEQRKQVMEMIKSYNKYGDALHKQHDLLEIAKNLHTIASFAENLTLSESEKTSKSGKSWFDEVTIKRNMNDLKKRCDEFAKCAEDAQKSNYRLEALWEEMGHILSRYYEIAGSPAEELPPGSGKKTVTKAPIVDEDADGMPQGGKTVTLQPKLDEDADGMPMGGKTVVRQPSSTLQEVDQLDQLKDKDDVSDVEGDPGVDPVPGIGGKGEEPGEEILQTRWLSQKNK